MKLQVENLNYSYDASPLVADIRLHVKQGEFVGLIGPNGSGKSTVLKNVYRALKPDSGWLAMDGEDLQAMKPKALALQMGVVGQENTVPFDFMVEDIVGMGRSPHKRLLEGDRPEDRRIVAAALAQTGMAEMARRNYRNLSGGEKQRVLLARALAQQTELLIMDEPTNHLDIYYQLQMFDLIQTLGVTVLAAIHDLNLAALYCSRLYVLKAGRLHRAGTPEEVLTPELIREVYGITAEVAVHPATGKLSIAYVPAGMAQREAALVR
ncbi:ABC transporter ATP-binding protein [Paenibacillus sp. IB182496]|uniref:ABC transporter ATP-binding protein n=1 Tax=Paenibacillus sabuli TaxID=2772509 RepID=A0A927BVV9_9BACL|nr:ABC transporter ATP-binding protein [Paenibacillus sabuli]MBD2847813.1 ABC transporter ATP-binding protein [Paenibacillus sabuli]